jgi:hypothetical protein
LPRSPSHLFSASNAKLSQPTNAHFRHYPRM